jgi:hypothetical protein
MALPSLVLIEYGIVKAVILISLKQAQTNRELRSCPLIPQFWGTSEVAPPKFGGLGGRKSQQFTQLRNSCQSKFLNV